MNVILCHILLYYVSYTPASVLQKTCYNHVMELLPVKW